MWAVPQHLPTNLVGSWGLTWDVGTLLDAGAAYALCTLPSLTAPQLQLTNVLKPKQCIHFACLAFLSPIGSLVSHGAYRDS
ncbi:hypothetical protein FKM82_021044 [Ascaphus truei]